ncbi:5-bromo-4-chloroindolyl phosphate hydrolysis family protein [Alkalibacterium sp.]|nr:MAG: phosphatase [Alkalibacterium sp.]
MKHSTLYTTIVYTITLLVTLFLFIMFIGGFDMNGFLAVGLSIGAGVLLLKSLVNRSEKSKNKEERLPRLTTDKEEFYLEKGLEKEDIHYFRQTMLTAKKHIVSIESNMEKSGKLRAIETRNNTVSLSKSLFSAITKEPNRLHEVNKFLYVHLPSLDDLVSKYVEIENHKAKSKATYDILAKSAQTIDKMCGQITDDYVTFKENDLEDLDTEIELAHHNLNKKRNEF